MINRIIYLNKYVKNMSYLFGGIIFFFYISFKLLKTRNQNKQ